MTQQWWRQWGEFLGAIAKKKIQIQWADNIHPNIYFELKICGDNLCFVLSSVFIFFDVFCWNSIPLLLPACLLVYLLSKSVDWTESSADNRRRKKDDVRGMLSTFSVDDFHQKHFFIFFCHMQILCWYEEIFYNMLQHCCCHRHRC